MSESDIRIERMLQEEPSETEVFREIEKRDQYYKYLDDLRESGVVNMFGVRPYLQRQFGLDPGEATAILIDWMSDFSRQAAIEEVLK